MYRNSRWWHPAPVDRPVVDPAFRHMDPLTRATEAWRYNLLRLEFWISPSGVLREWLRQVIRLALFLAAPVLLVLPLVTLLLASLVKITVLLASIAWKVVVLVVLFLVGFVVTAFNWLLLKTILSSRNIR